MVWQRSVWFGQTNFTLWDSSQQCLANSEASRRIDWCFRLYFVLSCFIHFVLLQLLIKHNICVSEMSRKHLPHYGLCYVRSNEWEPVFLIQKRKTARIKDVNKSQGKLTANLSSLVCLYFYYMVLSRSFLEMFFKKKSCSLCEFSWNLPSHSGDTVIGLLYQGINFWIFAFTLKCFCSALYNTQRDRTWLWFCALGHASQETGGPEVSDGWKLQGSPDNLRLCPDCCNGA